MLFDIRMRDAIDDFWFPPSRPDPGTPPVYELLDQAVTRIQTIDPSVIEEMLGPETRPKSRRDGLALEVQGVAIPSQGEFLARLADLIQTRQHPEFFRRGGRTRRSRR
jgi:hypothetical protein